MAKTNFTELDFDLIKGNLKEYLKSQSEFKDYNFESSSISVLLDILSYNTQYNAYYANMLANENFMETAELRNSVVSRASLFGYVPASRSSSSSTVTISLVPNENLSDVLIPKYTLFTSSVSGNSYNFYTLRDYLLQKNADDDYIMTNIILSEGDLITQTFNYDINNPPKFVIINENVDTNTINVTVQNSISDSFTEIYNQNTDTVNLTSTSLVYFLKENIDGLYEIEFGDGVIGKKINDGNIVKITYLNTSGSAANGCSTFNLEDNLNLSSINITTVNPSQGGSERSSINDIKFNSTKFFNTQNRAVTKNDIKDIITTNYNGIESINVWGGEENDPPEYGKVFISLKPTGSLDLSEGTKNLINNNILKNKTIVSVIPEFLSPNYINLELKTKIIYDSNKTNIPLNQMRNNAFSKIYEYLNLYTNKFSTTFNKNILSQKLFELNSSHISIEMDYSIRKDFEMLFNTSNTFSLNLNSPIYHPNNYYLGSVRTNYFNILDQNNELVENVYIEDYKGILRVILNLADSKIVYSEVGTVDYTNGKINITQFEPYSSFNNTLKVYITLKNNIFSTEKDKLITYSKSDISIDYYDNYSGRLISDTGTSSSSNYNSILQSI